jgi:hypothetical protein
VAGTSYGRLGIARVYALVFGIAYVAVALIEDIAGSGKGVMLGSRTLLRLAATQNVIHWVVGVAVLGSFFAGERAARMVARVVGIVFVVVTVVGFAARTWTGKTLGYHGPLPMSYNVIHAVTAILALFAGFAAERAYGRTAQGA